MSSRRRSNRSDRAYACSVLLPKRVGKRSLSHGPGGVRRLHAPRLEAGTESVHGCRRRKAVVAEHLRQRHVGELPPARRWEYEPAVVGQVLGAPQDLHGGVRTAGHGARGSPSCARPGWSTSGRQGRSRSTERLGPRRERAAVSTRNRKHRRTDSLEADASTLRSAAPTSW